MQVDWQIALLLERFLYTENMGEDLAFVISGTARKHVTISQDRFERRRFPKFKWIGRLHIVMTVNQNRAPAVFMFILRPDNWMTGSRNQFGLQSDFVQL